MGTPGLETQMHLETLSVCRTVLPSLLHFANLLFRSLLLVEKIEVITEIYQALETRLVSSPIVVVTNAAVVIIAWVVYVKKSSLAKLKNKKTEKTHMARESRTPFAVIVAGAGAGRRHYRRVVYL